MVKDYESNVYRSATVHHSFPLFVKYHCSFRAKNHTVCKWNID
ncbi:hypothetical protein D915_010857 [Fasciola hepatica]|uniref:Uncharacterized protein n=1 Tax=Fasciola hepatica TaxID=6192 RepID=A0A4E0QYU3_FASHE|nr:hypothetical protein D915_010857 [Fasciola hepatica]